MTDLVKVDATRSDHIAALERERAQRLVHIEQLTAQLTALREKRRRSVVAAADTHTDNTAAGAATPTVTPVADATSTAIKTSPATATVTATATRKLSVTSLTSSSSFSSIPSMPSLPPPPPPVISTSAAVSDALVSNALSQLQSDLMVQPVSFCHCGGDFFF